MKFAVVRVILGAALMTGCYGERSSAVRAEETSRNEKSSPSPSVAPTKSAPPDAPSKPNEPSPVEASKVALPKVSAAWENGAVQSPFGVVTSVEKSATAVGIGILEAGGNAVDAAVGTAFALAVTHQSAASLGGGGFLLLRKGKTSVALDFREQSPASLTLAHFQEALRNGAAGPYAVGVPGMVAGLLAAHEEFGSLPRSQVLQGAIQLAENGYPLGVQQAATLARTKRELESDPVGKRLFYAKGGAPKAGTTLKNPALARLLRSIAESGPSAFYSGANARELARTTRLAISEKDLSSYSARKREPLRVEVGDWTATIMPPPSGGGIVLAEALQLTKGLFATSSPLDAADLHVIAEALRRGHVDRRFAVVDPDTLSERDYKSFVMDALSPRRHAAHPIVPMQRTPSLELDARFASALAELEHTTHFSVVDRHGDSVSCTVTLSASYGARLLTPSGYVLNNSVLSFAASGANQPRPNVRTVSSMTPTLVSHPSGITLVLGSPGGDTIPGTVLQVFTRLARGSSLFEAVRAPRLHQGFVPDALLVEATFPANILAELRGFGHTVHRRSPIGDANVAIAMPGRALAVADYREGGSAAGARPPTDPR